jgi:hypothetical protein
MQVASTPSRCSYLPSETKRASTEIACRHAGDDGEKSPRDVRPKERGEACCNPEVEGKPTIKASGDDWGILLVAIILAILLPWWMFVSLPFMPLLVLMLVCGLFGWK